MSAKTKYRVTTRRPVAGRMRQPGEIVEMTALEAATEIGWGGLERLEEKISAGSALMSSAPAAAAIAAAPEAEPAAEPAATRRRAARPAQ